MPPTPPGTRPVAPARVAVANQVARTSGAPAPTSSHSDGRRPRRWQARVTPVPSTSSSPAPRRPSMVAPRVVACSTAVPVPTAGRGTTWMASASPARARVVASRGTVRLSLTRVMKAVTTMVKTRIERALMSKRTIRSPRTADAKWAPAPSSAAAPKATPRRLSTRGRTVTTTTVRSSARDRRPVSGLCCTRTSRLGPLTGTPQAMGDLPDKDRPPPARLDNRLAFKPVGLVRIPSPAVGNTAPGRQPPQTTEDLPATGWYHAAGSAVRRDAGCGPAARPVPFLPLPGTRTGRPSAGRRRGSGQAPKHAVMGDPASGLPARPWAETDPDRCGSGGRRARPPGPRTPRRPPNRGMFP